MTDSYDDEEWVEICDSSGRRAAMRHLATIRYSGKTYFILGALSEEEDGPEAGGLLLVREDKTVDGAQEYVVADDENEIDGVVTRFVSQALIHFADNAACEQEDDVDLCGMKHRPGEFCVCGDPNYLQ